MAEIPRWAQHAVASAAAEARDLLVDGRPLTEVWRYAVLQLMDDYTTLVRHHGVGPAAALWSDEPTSTGDARVDAAFAALAEHLARRDGWAVPLWATDPSREAVEWWFVTDLRGLEPSALVESPLSFRKRGIFVTEDSLERA